MSKEILQTEGKLCQDRYLDLHRRTKNIRISCMLDMYKLFFILIINLKVNHLTKNNKSAIWGYNRCRSNIYDNYFKNARIDKM